MTSSKSRPHGWQASLVLVMSTVALACAVARPGTSPSPAGPSQPPPTAEPTSATLAPTASPSPTGATPAATTTTPTPTPTDYEQQPPPFAGLSVGAQLEVPGLQGSWCYEYGCADIIPPGKDDLPKLEVSRRAVLTVTMPASVPFVHWTARYGGSTNGDALLVDEGGSDFDPDVPPETPYPLLTEAEFTAPPRGDWVLTVTLRFGPPWGGDATYYWHLIVQ